LGPDLPNRRRFTVTELSDYLRCPKGYELQYLRDLRHYTEAAVSEWGAWRGVRRGTLAHLALEYLGRDRQADPQEVAERALKAFPLGHAPPDKVLSDLTDLLSRYMDSETFAMVAAASSLRTEARLLFTLDRALIQGKVDAAATDERDQLHLVDYKTGASRDQGQHAFQLGLYCAGLEGAVGSLPASATVHYLDQGRAEALDVAAAAHDARSQALRAIAGICSGDFPPHTDRCAHCALHWACDARAL
ncbi:MAG: PD-(D/E)XK nuclease family protein, partial [Armatimonadota bacterium]